MATVINSLLLRGVLQSRGEAEVRVLTAIPINTVAEPYIRLRAIRHLEHQIIVLLAAGTGNPYVTNDYPAVQRAIELRAEALLAAKNGIDGVYSSDPKNDPAAWRYQSISYNKLSLIILKLSTRPRFCWPAIIICLSTFSISIHPGSCSSCAVGRTWGHGLGI